MEVTNQFNCLFMSRKGNCKKGGICHLKNLLSRNGTADKKELLITFLGCYQLNYEKNRKVGESFFRVTSKQITGKNLKPLAIYDASTLSDVLQGKPTKNSCMFRIPKTWNTIFKSFGI